MYCPLGTGSYFLFEKEGRVRGYLWDESVQPRSLGGAWKGAKNALYSLRDWRSGSRGTAFHLPTDLGGVITETEVKKLGLRVGDYVETDDAIEHECWRITAVNGVPVAPVRRVRGRKSLQTWETGSTYRRNLLRFPHHPLANLVTALYPIPEGSAVLVEGVRGARKSDVIWAMLEGIDKKDLVVMYFLAERPDEVPLVPGQLRPEEASFIPEVPRKVELWAMSMRQREHQADIVAWVDFAFNVAKSRALADQRVVILLDSVEVLAKAMDRSADANGRALSGGLSGKVVDQLAAKYLAVAGHPEGKGSLTVIASYRLNPQDKGTASLAEEFEGVINAQILLDPTRRFSPFPVSVGGSFSRRIEKVVGQKLAGKTWAFQKGMGNRYDELYAALYASRLNAFQEQRRRAGDKRQFSRLEKPDEEALKQTVQEAIELEWQLLLEAAERLSPRALIEGWRNITVGRYSHGSRETEPCAVVAQQAPEAAAEVPTPVALKTGTVASESAAPVVEETIPESGEEAGAESEEVRRAKPPPQKGEVPQWRAPSDEESRRLAAEAFGWTPRDPTGKSEPDTHDE